MTNMHISRGWGSDPFAPECGCVLLPCGHVSAEDAGDCYQHDMNQARTLRSMHLASECPESKTGTFQAGDLRITVSRLGVSDD